jgi:Domain of unknown function (DUF4416)
MGSFKEPRPVKLFAGLLLNSEDLLVSVEEDLIELFGSIDSSSGIIPWVLSEYYAKEMGTGLLRRFVSFDPLISPEKLPEIKLQTQTLEGKYQWVRGEERGRRVNIDPGYIDAGKVVLASTKNAAHRIYLHSGIYAEATLIFHDGSFQPFVYTYKDYLWPETRSFFSALRSLYLSQLRQGN